MGRAAAEVLRTDWEAVTLPLYPKTGLLPPHPLLAAKEFVALKRPKMARETGLLDRLLSSLERLIEPSPL